VANALDHHVYRCVSYYIISKSQDYSDVSARNAIGRLTIC